MSIEPAARNTRERSDSALGREVKVELGALLDRAYAGNRGHNGGWSAVAQGLASRVEARDLVFALWESLLWKEKILFPRVLRAAPSVQCRVEISAVVARSYGHGNVSESHAFLVQNLLSELGGVPATDVEEKLESDRRREPAIPWVSGLMALLVDRSVGPTLAQGIADALRDRYGISEHGTKYFRNVAEHGGADSAVCVQLLSDFVIDEATRGMVIEIASLALNSSPAGRFAWQCSPIVTDFSFQASIMKETV